MVRAKKSSGFEVTPTLPASVVGGRSRFGRWLGVVHEFRVGCLVGFVGRLLGPVTLSEFLDRARLDGVMAHDNT
ncbi:hypothetical protein [Halorubrum sp. PV6]|uniref:hypothetical protein n=1 Tax=Halorubrum sp. PV6 TaxID=634157 RepID=UPI001444AF0A|nr:hypothetical protein [Halorubrum sp. PV6]